MNKKKSFLTFRNLAILFILSLSLFLQKSFPYTYWQCENEPVVYRSGWTNLFLHPTLGNDSDSYNLRAQWAMSQWNNVANSNWNFFYRTEDHAVVLGDGYAVATCHGLTSKAPSANDGYGFTDSNPSFFPKPAISFSPTSIASFAVATFID